MTGRLGAALRTAAALSAAVSVGTRLVLLLATLSFQASTQIRDNLTQSLNNNIQFLVTFSSVYIQMTNIYSYFLK